MLTGVQALVIAAATASLPFTPPQGWVQMPSAAVSTQATNAWKGPVLTGGKRASFSTITMPFPGSVDALAAAMKAHRHTGPVTVISDAPVKVCGVSGRMLTLKFGTGTTAQTIQQELLAKNGRGYMLIYMRPTSTAVDPHIVSVMKQFCPSGTASIRQLTPPKGWTAGGEDMHMIGMWMGTKPGEMIMLMRGSALQPLSKVAGQMQTGMSSPDARKYMKLVGERQFQLCGNPAMQVSLQMNMPSFPMAMEQVLTQADGVTYILGYMHPASVAADPAAQSALQTLCATGAPRPISSATPEPLPSSSALPQTPSPSPTPAATATPPSASRSV
jgi:hypothetical protein